MKLSEVLKYIELLDDKKSQPDFIDAIRHLEHIVFLITTHATQIGDFSSDIASAAQDVHRSFSKVENVLLDLRTVLEKVKTNLEPEMFANSYRLWEQEMRYETNDYILSRRLSISPEDQEVMYGHLLNYTDWRVPGMIIRPGEEKWIEHMVPLDPLYVVDTNLELMAPAIGKFTEEYQQRLRPYAITDFERTSILAQIPDNQFGFIFAYNYFNYVPIEIIKRYLKELFGKLRPGGTFMFTFNDCNWAHSAALAEKNFMCYTPGSMIEHEAMMQGFEIIYKHHGQNDVNWLEIKRPGNITGIRGGQSLARVLEKS